MDEITRSDSIINICVCLHQTSFCLCQNICQTRYRHDVDGFRSTKKQSNAFRVCTHMKDIQTKHYLLQTLITIIISY